jgi:hypothetical protein
LTIYRESYLGLYKSIALYNAHVVVFYSNADVDRILLPSGLCKSGNVKGYSIQAVANKALSIYSNINIEELYQRMFNKQCEIECPISLATCCYKTLRSAHTSLLQQPPAKRIRIK